MEEESVMRKCSKGMELEIFATSGGYAAPTARFTVAVGR